MNTPGVCVYVRIAYMYKKNTQGYRSVVYQPQPAQYTMNIGQAKICLWNLHSQAQ